MHATDEKVDSAAVLTGHFSRVMNVSQIPLAHKHIVKKMPIFLSRRHAGCIRVISLLKNCVRNGELELSVDLEQEAPIEIAVNNNNNNGDFYVLFSQRAPRTLI